MQKNALTASQFHRTQPERYTRPEAAFCQTGNQTYQQFTDEFTLAVADAAAGKRPAYLTPSHPYSSKIAQVKAQIPLTVHPRGNGSLPEIGGSPPESGWGHARISHPRDEAARGRMAIFEGLRICEQQNDDTDMSPLVTPARRLPTGGAPRPRQEEPRNRAHAATIGQQ